MSELIVPADGELAVIDALKPRFPGEVSGRVPSSPSAPFFRVVTVGGSDRDLVTTEPRVAVESFAKDQGVAVQRAMLALGHLLADGRAGVLGGVVCHEVRVVSLPANLPFPSLPTWHRYTFTISAALRSAVI